METNPVLSFNASTGRYEAFAGTTELIEAILARKLARGKAVFLAPRMIPFFHAIWGMRRTEEKPRLTRIA